MKKFVDVNFYELKKRLENCEGNELINICDINFNYYHIKSIVDSFSNYDDSINQRIIPTPKPGILLGIWKRGYFIEPNIKF